MAFHPFKHFRKHQKAYLAGLTILTMIIFVFSFGAADPFQQALHWIGAGHHGDPVLELYGKTIHTDELDKLRIKRQLASEFLIAGSTMSFGRAGTPLEKSFFDIQQKFGPKEGQKDPTPMQMTLSDVFADVLLPQPASEEHFRQLKLKLGNIQKKLAASQNNEDQYRALDALATMLAYQSWIADPQFTDRARGGLPNASYFGGSLRPEDLLDFLVWKHEADRMGITLTQADVCRQVNRAWGNGDYLQPDGKFEGNDWVKVFFHNNQNIHKSLTARDLLEALTDEFRVSLAREAVLGTASGVRSYRQAVDGIHTSPSAATPDQLYRYFQEQRTTLSVSMLPIPVKSFVEKVQATPSEADLRNLYERYKKTEPSPSRRQPGFMEPRRIQLEYVSYRTDGPFARKLAAKAIELRPVFSVGMPASTFAAGGGPGWAATLAGFVDTDMAVRALYDQYLDEEKLRRSVKYDRFDTDAFGLKQELQGERGVEVQAATALLGELLGDIGTGAAPLAAPTGYLAANEYHRRATLTAYSAAVLAGASPSPLQAMTLPMRYVYTTQPFEAVRPQLRERFETTLARKLMESNVLTFRKELDKVLASPPEDREKKLDEFLKKALPEYGLEDLHAMKGAQTQQEMKDHPDPALKELQTAWDRSPEKPFHDPTKDPEQTGFARDMFVPFESMQKPKDAPARSEQLRSASGDVVWVFWKPQDLRARVRDFDVIRKEVEEAWYLEQARKLAREKAQDINKELKEKNLSPDDALKFLIQQDLGKPFQLDRVSHLTAPVFNLPNQEITPSNYNRYQAPRDYIPYPPSDFVDQLLKLKKRGDSLVMADRPVTHFYVAVLMENPQPPERREFYAAYKLLNADSNDFLSMFREDPLWSKMMTEQQRTYARKVMEQLRADATKDLDNGEYVLPENVRNRTESSIDAGQ